MHLSKIWRFVVLWWIYFKWDNNTICLNLSMIYCFILWDKTILRYSVAINLEKWGQTKKPFHKKNRGSIEKKNVGQTLSILSSWFWNNISKEADRHEFIYFHISSTHWHWNNPVQMCNFVLTLQPYWYDACASSDSPNI